MSTIYGRQNKFIISLTIVIIINIIIIFSVVHWNS